MAELSLHELLEAIKATADLMSKALDAGNSSEAKRLMGLLDYLVDQAMAVDKQLH